MKLAIIFFALIAVAGCARNDGAGGLYKIVRSQNH